MTTCGRCCARPRAERRTHNQCASPRARSAPRAASSLRPHPRACVSAALCGPARARWAGCAQVRLPAAQSPSYHPLASPFPSSLAGAAACSPSPRIGRASPRWRARWATPARPRGAPPPSGSPARDRTRELGLGLVVFFKCYGKNRPPTESRHPGARVPHTASTFISQKVTSAAFRPAPPPAATCTVWRQHVRTLGDGRDQHADQHAVWHLEACPTDSGCPDPSGGDDTQARPVNGPAGELSGCVCTVL